MNSITMTTSRRAPTGFEAPASSPRSAGTRVSRRSRAESGPPRGHSAVRGLPGAAVASAPRAHPPPTGTATAGVNVRPCADLAAGLVFPADLGDASGARTPVGARCSCSWFMGVHRHPLGASWAWRCSPPDPAGRERSRSPSSAASTRLSAGGFPRSRFGTICRCSILGAHAQPAAERAVRPGARRGGTAVHPQGAGPRPRCVTSAARSSPPVPAARAWDDARRGALAGAASSGVDQPALAPAAFRVPLLHGGGISELYGHGGPRPGLPPLES